ncbi:MAG: flagellar motor switch protein FliN [Candidatus Zixiibacteriota bacterium]
MPDENKPDASLDEEQQAISAAQENADAENRDTFDAAQAEDIPGDIHDEFSDLSNIRRERQEAHPAEFQQLSPAPSGNNLNRNIDLLLDVKMPVSIELGRTSMAISDLLTLGPGSVVELNKLAGDPVDLLVNNALIAKGEVVVVDENFGVRITLLMSPEERLKSLAQQ